MNKRIAVIIPAYNEEKTVGEVVRGVKALDQGFDVVVVNDSSRDKTAQSAEAAGATVIELPYNLGIGGAVQTGYKYAVMNGYDGCVQVDGDGQHPPEEITKLVEPLFANDYDIVIGSRFIGQTTYRVPFMRALGIRIISIFLKVVCGMSVKDTTSGFRALNGRAMAFFATEYPQDYPEPESLLFAHRKKFKVMEISIEMKDREHGISSITPFRAVYYMTKVLLAMTIDLFREFQE
jgi:glycosyltransferase involved in cell wall biosynthesis